MGALCGVLAASGVAHAHTRAACEVRAPAACLDAATLMNLLTGQLEDENEAIHEILVALDSSNDPDEKEALLLQLQVQMSKRESTTHMMMQLVRLAEKLGTEPRQPACHGARLTPVLVSRLPDDPALMDQ